MFSALDLLGCGGVILLMLGGAASYRMVWLCLPRRRSGECAGCGYSLRGIGAGSVCPECGLPGGQLKPLRSTWSLVGSAILWGSINAVAVITLFVLKSGRQAEAGQWAMTIVMFLPAIIVPSILSFVVAAKGSWLVAQAASLGSSLILVALAFYAADGATSHPFATFAACMAPIVFPMMMGWGCWLAYFVYLLIRERA